LSRWSFSAFRRPAGWISGRASDRASPPKAHGGRYRSAALFAVAALIPLLALAGYSAYRNIQAQRAQAQIQAIDDARLLSAFIDQELLTTVDAAQALAESPTLDPPADLDRFRSAADREIARHPLWLDILLFDPQTDRAVFSTPPRPPAPALDRKSLDQVAQTLTPAVGDIIHEPYGWAIPVRAPAVRNGRLRYVVTVKIRPDRLQAMLGELHAPPGWILTVINENGRVVARSRRPADYVGRHMSAAATRARADRPIGIYRGYNLEHTRTVAAYWTSKKTGWSVFVAIPRADLEARLWRSGLPLVLGLTASLLLSAAFLVLFLRELDARRARETALEQAARLEALGRLTGGVAHDFNNVLTVIQGNAAILRRKLKDPVAEPHLDAIRQASEQAAKQIRQLLVFARGGASQTATVDLNEAVETALAAIRQLVGPAITVRARRSDSPACVEIDPIQLEAAMFNLAANARDAMPSGGVVELAVRTERAFAELSVSDTGEGVPPELLSRVFDPFFTTKAGSKGTGLGLAQVYGLVRRAGGAAEIRSTVGRGTTVILRLPLASSRPERLDLKLAPPPAEEHGPRILLVDDDEAVRATVAAFLRDAGLCVREARCASDALGLLQAEPFDALVSDVVLPGELDGLALAKAARDRHPALPVLLISGYAPSASEAAAQGFTVLPKPLDLPGLELRLRAQRATRAIR
jgi:signal transduction histidine kinase